MFEGRIKKFLTPFGKADIVIRCKGGLFEEPIYEVRIEGDVSPHWVAMGVASFLPPNCRFIIVLNGKKLDTTEFNVVL